jgi:DNA-binding MarR family transcriptional regulator
MDLFDEQACRHLGVGRNDLRALNLLEDGPLAAGVLAERLSVTRAAVTALVDRLARDGYVERIPAPEDRRTVLVRLRPETWAAFAGVYRPLGEQVQHSTRRLDEGRRQAVVEALELMAVAFEDGRAALARPR